MCFHFIENNLNSPAPFLSLCFCNLNDRVNKKIKKNKKYTIYIENLLFMTSSLISESTQQNKSQVIIYCVTYPRNVGYV